MKWIPALVKSSILALGLTTWIPAVLALTHNNFTNVNSGIHMQVGFYDLLSEQKEIYDTSLVNRNGTIILTVTNPDDTHFLSKGKLVNNENKDGFSTFEYKPIYYSGSSNNQMFDDILDFMTHNRAELTAKTINGQYVAMMQNGMIFLHTPIVERTTKKEK